MRRLCALQVAALAVAWFFTFEHPLPDSEEGAMVRGLVGPFTTEAICKVEQAYLASLIFPGLKVSQCIERKQA